MSERFESFEDFWPFYVLEHSSKLNRTLHFVGTTAAVSLLGYAVKARKYHLLPLVLVAGYGPAWVGHFFVEKNRPASFKHPLWSLRGDFRMWGKIISGRMDYEVELAKKQRSVTEVEAKHAGATNGAASNGAGHHAEA